MFFALTLLFGLLVTMYAFAFIKTAFTWGIWWGIAALLSLVGLGALAAKYRAEFKINSPL